MASKTAPPHVSVEHHEAFHAVEGSIAFLKLCNEFGKTAAILGNRDFQAPGNPITDRGLELRSFHIESLTSAPLKALIEAQIDYPVQSGDLEDVGGSFTRRQDRTEGRGGAAS